MPNDNLMILRSQRFKRLAASGLALAIPPWPVTLTGVALANVAFAALTWIGKYDLGRAL